MDRRSLHVDTKLSAKLKIISTTLQNDTWNVVRRAIEEVHIEKQIIIDSLRLYTKECYALTKDGKEE